MLCDISPRDSFLGRKYVYWLIIPSIHFASMMIFHLLYWKGKSVTVSLKILLVFGQWNFGENLWKLSHCLIGESVLLWMTSWHHYSVVLMSVMASQITGVSIVYSTLSSGAHKKKPSKLHAWPLWREFAGEFPAQRTSNTENVSIWWRHHDHTGCSQLATSVIQ